MGSLAEDVLILAVVLCAVGNVGRLGTKFVVFFQQIFFVGARIGRLGGVIREMNPK